MLNKLTEQNKARPLIAVHRGKSGASVPENTVESGLLAIRSGADIVEFDTCGTLDGGIVVFHVGAEYKVLFPSFPVKLSLLSELKRRGMKSAYGKLAGYHLYELKEYLTALKGKCILNLDRIWNANIKKSLKVVADLDMFDQILIKARVTSEKDPLLLALKEYPDAWFMPICKTYDGYETALSACRAVGIEPRGYEVIFYNESDKLCSDEFINMVHADGKFLWANTINLSGRKDMCANHSDRNAMFGNPNDHWGYLADKGFDVLQTDWPCVMRNYFDNRNK